MRRQRAPRPTAAERGAVTAELVVVLPVLAAVTLALAWLLGLGVAQVRTVDAAREAARAVARGDDAGEAISRAQSVGPEGTVVTVQRAGDTVTARALARVAGPGGLFGRIAPVQLHAVAVAVAEDDGGAG